MQFVTEQHEGITNLPGPPLTTLVTDRYLRKCQAVLRVDDAHASSSSSSSSSVVLLDAIDIDTVSRGLPALERFAAVSEGGIHLVSSSSSSSLSSSSSSSLSSSWSTGIGGGGINHGELTRVVEGFDGWTVCLRLAPADAADAAHISKEIVRLEVRVARAQSQLQAAQGRLSSEAYRARASVRPFFAGPFLLFVFSCGPTTARGGLFVSSNGIVCLLR